VHHKFIRIVDLFSHPHVTPNCKAVRWHLLEYYSLLESSNLTHSVLSSLPLPHSLDPKNQMTIPSRLYTLLIFIRDSIAALIQLSFFIIPLLVHSPVYVMGRVGGRLLESEEETQAQNKVAFGLLSLLLVYPAKIFFLCQGSVLVFKLWGGLGRWSCLPICSLSCQGDRS
jgi:glycerol-3-phosphate O-acyltransferase/dihydroxyacetone phosphate acyltransferase